MRRDHSSQWPGVVPGTEHLVAEIALVDHPVAVKMLGHAKTVLAGLAPDDQVGDPLSLVEIAAFACRLEGGHQRLGQVHVGVLPVIGGDHRPVGVELLGNGAVLLFPEFGFEDLGHVGQHLGGERVPEQLGAGGSEQHEGVAIALLPPIARPVIVDGPEVTASLGVAMPLPQELHAVVDDLVGAGAPQETPDDEAMHHARRRMDAAHRVRSVQRLAGRIEVEEAALRVESAILEEPEQPVGLLQEPAPVIATVAPGLGGRRRHLQLPRFLRQFYPAGGTASRATIRVA